MNIRTGFKDLWHGLIAIKYKGKGFKGDGFKGQNDVQTFYLHSEIAKDCCEKNKNEIEQFVQSLISDD